MWFVLINYKALASTHGRPAYLRALLCNKGLRCYTHALLLKITGGFQNWISVLIYWCVSIRHTYRAAISKSIYTEERATIEATVQAAGEQKKRTFRKLPATTKQAQIRSMNQLQSLTVRQTNNRSSSTQGLVKVMPTWPPHKLLNLMWAASFIPPPLLRSLANPTPN